MKDLSLARDSLPAGCPTMMFRAPFISASKTPQFEHKPMMLTELIALRTDLGSIGRINQLHGYTGQCRLVLDLQRQLVERPGVVDAALFLGDLGAVPHAARIFHTGYTLRSSRLTLAWLRTYTP